MNPLTNPSQGTPSKASPLRVDMRLPFAVSLAEGLLLLALYTVLVYLGIQRPLAVGIGFIVFYLATAGAMFIAFAWRLSRTVRAEEAAERLNTDIYRMFRTVIDIPYAVVNSDGTVRIVNSALQDILGFRAPVCNIPLRDVCPTVSMEQIVAGAKNPDKLPRGGAAVFPLQHDAEHESAVVTLQDGHRYLVEPYLLSQRSERYYFLMFRDVSQYLDLLDETNRRHVVLAYIVLDNLQELTQFVRANYRATANEIETTLSRWVEGMNGMLREYDRDKYLALFSEEMLDRCIKDNFSILGEIMKIRVGDNSFPVSVSMGIADVDGSMQERDDAARNALEIALGRGGNQVALVRRGIPGVTYFGGAHKTLESNTSITSRVSASLLERHLSHSDNVLIMGHKDPDFDAIGSTVGAYRLCRSILAAQGRASVPVHIVTDGSNDSFRICRAHLDTLPEYNDAFIDRDAAQQMLTTRTALIITDVNNPYLFEAPALVGRLPERDGTSPIAVIDHHRLTGKLPFTPFLQYIETTKSSASEIIAEILQQSDYAETLYKEEANLLLAGIMLDTHNFTRSAGAQTFEITSYLYSRNAHTGTAREFFNERIEELMVSSDFDAHTRIYQDVFAITWRKGDKSVRIDERVAASKAADKLLTVRGIEASFAISLLDGNVSISGRSKGKINVQLILEKLDGGGHFDMAGAQLASDSLPEAYELLRSAIDEYILQNPELFAEED